MLNLAENCTVVTICDPQSLSSTQTAEWINMRYYDKVSFIMNIGAITTGGTIQLKKAVNVSGSSSSSLTGWGHYYKSTATTDVFTKTSATSSGSVDSIVVGNSSDNKCWIVEVDGSILAGDTSGRDCISMPMPAAFASALTSVVAICHKARYQSDAPPTALT